MEGRLLGEDALLVECADPAEVRATYAEALRRREAGLLHCADVVPAARTVLLDGVRRRDEVLAGLADWPTSAPDAAESLLVELAVVYDGPDLEAVAAHWGVSVEEAVARHRSVEHVVEFCGFAPGFAYLSGLPEELRVPRLEEPRTSVPRGAVGLAGPWTGIYPRSSPGGWQLIARTEERLWQLDRDPPALLVPGTRVRFVDG